MSFYMTLPSNSSFSTFPNNSVSDFRTKLASRINLSSRIYEVAVTEVSYPTNILQFPKNYELGWIGLFDKSTSEFKKVFLTKESFSNPQELIENIHEVLHEEFPNRTEFVLVYNEETNRIGLSVNENKYTIQFSEKLKSVLGLGEEVHNIVFFHNVYNGKYPVDLRAGTYTGYLYTDIIEPQIVGDNLIQLLRVFPFEGGANKLTSMVFQNPYYKRLSASEFDTIHVFLRNEVGERIVFASGILTVTLHFREVK
jgi:hypothetical protein